MTQSDIIKLLKANKSTWYKSKDMAKVIGINNASVGSSLKILRKWNLIEFKLENNGSYSYMLYKYKA